MRFLKVKGNKGIYYDPDYRPEKLNISGALALFAPSYEALEYLKHDVVENMQYAIERIKEEAPENESEIRTEVRKLMTEETTEGPRRVLKRIVQRQRHLQQPAKRQGGVTEAQIEEAREYPLEDLIDKKIFKAGGKWRANCHCPLVGHEGEKTPSFYIE